MRRYRPQRRRADRHRLHRRGNGQFEMVREPRVTVVIPTLAADDTYKDCLRSLETQTLGDVEIVVVDNSGNGLVRADRAKVIHNRSNVGFGAAINQGWRACSSPFVATLNDDAVAHAGWLEALVAAAEENERVGMCASQVRLFGTGRLDSAGMRIAADGTSKQRGQGEQAERYAEAVEVLLPSGSAALYRRAMLDEIGGFDEDFFLYCEDTDLGLRARWAGWRCIYVPGAVVEHRYSHSAGQASPLKAYYVERNRIWTALKNFPLQALLRAPGATVARYYYHWMTPQGTAAVLRKQTSLFHLAWLVMKTRLATLFALVSLLRKRRAIRRGARISTPEFLRLLEAHHISVREVASL